MHVMNFDIDNNARLLLKIQQNGVLVVIYFIRVMKYVFTVKIIKVDFVAITISFPYFSLASSY